jgi:hypothetical protein
VTVVDQFASGATLPSFESLAYELTLLCWESESDIARTYTEKALRLLCSRLNPNLALALALTLTPDRNLNPQT